MEPRAHISNTTQQEQKLIMSYAMQRAFHVLQMPLTQLSEWVQNEIERNPALEMIPPPSHSNLSSVRSEATLYEYLEREIDLHFKESAERQLASFIAGSLNAKGFLTLSEKEICKIQGISSPFYRKVLETFHQIEPIGLGAKDAREALLLQLTFLGKAKSPIYHITAKHYDDLLHNRLHRIAKAMRLSTQTVSQLIQRELKCLDPFPGYRFNREVVQHMIPDLLIEEEEGIWKVEVYGDSLPTFYVHSHYVECLKQKKLPREDLNFIRSHLASGKWLTHTLNRRKKILKEIGIYLLKTQRNFLEGVDASPIPLKKRDVASALGLSESTIARAIQHKYLSSPRGIIPLSHFFSHTIQTNSGIISPQTAKDFLLKLIQGENKENPFSDQTLSNLLAEKGVPCARRTVTKYRKSLKIEPRFKRKLWR